MCACRQKKSFFIEDILQDSVKKPYKNLSNEPTQPLKCNAKTEMAKEAEKTPLPTNDEKITRFNVTCEVQKEMQLTKMNLEQRRNTYPLYPTPVKVNMPWPTFRSKDQVGYPVEPRPAFSYYSDPMLNSDHMLRSHLAANRFVSHPFTIGHSYGYDRGEKLGRLLTNYYFLYFFVFLFYNFTYTKW